MAKALRLNEQIRISPVRVINHLQEQLGVMPTHEALTLAREVGLDLVEVSPMERPPVCRIMDFGKHQYEKKKRQKVAGHGHVITLKEIRLRPKTDAHDRMIKLNHARGFLENGHKVQFTMLFRGRERFHREIAQEAFGAILAELGSTVKVERAPAMDGRRMTMVVSPQKVSAKSTAPAPATPDAPPAPRHRLPVEAKVQPASEAMARSEVGGA